jgi:polar amino acid transport system substrate-binding protein
MSYIKWVIIILILMNTHLSHANTIKLVSGNNFKPWTDSKLENGGIVTEIVIKAFERAKIKNDLHWRPWKRGYIDVVSGNYFATFPYVWSEKRDKEVYFSVPIITTGTAFFVRKEVKVNYNADNDYGEFKGLTYCSPIGYDTKIKSELLKQNIHMVEASYVSSCFKMIALGRVDFISLNIQSGKAIINSLNLANDFNIYNQEQVKYHLIVTKNQPDSLKTLEKLNSIINDMQKSGEIEKIITRQLSKDFQKK